MDRVNFKINGVEYSVGCEVSSDMTLLDYIRHSLMLRGTKYMCREAGCGACIVAAVKRPGESVIAVNSCLAPILSCQDWEITTIEKVGNKKDGYHVLQETLAENNGTQCGYCTPGWIMSMYRCTGYRPILQAFKTFAKDSPKPNKVTDIEDLYICKKSGRTCSEDSCSESDWCVISEKGVNNVIEIHLADGKYWYNVQNINDLFEVMNKTNQLRYMLLAGNTGKGVYPIDSYPQVLIDIREVTELKGYKFDQNLIIGAGNTLSDLITIIRTVSNEEYFDYLNKFDKHLDLVAHNPVRNVGTVGGNLMLKHQHNDFPSDLFLLFETVGAQLAIVDCIGNTHTVTLQNFIHEDMTGKIIHSVLLPPLNNKYFLETFKVMQRYQSSSAIVNAGFLYKLNKSNNTVLEARIVFGNLSPKFFRATITEQYLIGKEIFKNDILQSALKELESELIVVDAPPKPSKGFRKQLAINLFYKGLLSLSPMNLIDSKYLSGATKIHSTRPVSIASQSYSTDQSQWPMYQPVPKVEALIQCSGEAAYTDDLPLYPHEVFAAFVLSTVATGDIISMDPSTALKLSGVIAFYTAKDIPGLNSFTMDDSTFSLANEELLCSGSVKFHSQPIGIIVAISEAVANRAAKLIDVKYSNVKRPVIDISEAKKDPKRVSLFTSVDANDKGTDVTKVIKGQYTLGGQIHVTLETQVCVVRPTEEGLEVHAATQWMDGVHVMISRALKMDQSCIDVHVRRLGGSYGAKLTRNAQVAVACSLVAYKLNLPCRFIVPFTTVTKSMGKRFPCLLDFEIGVNDSGLIQYLNYDFYEDQGYMINEPLILSVIGSLSNCYDISRWSYKIYTVLTDTAKNTWFRAPGSLEAISLSELLMERIAYELTLDPLEVRLTNMEAKYATDLKEMLKTHKINTNYTERKTAVTRFNASNMWKKRGLRFVLMRWTPLQGGYLNVNLSVFQGDGTVILTHGGIEMGQGLNTKAVQTCAYLLNIPMDKIKIKSGNSNVAPNSFLAGGSITSQNVVIGVTKCCKKLLSNLEPIKRQLTGTPTWEELVAKAYKSEIDLQTHGITQGLTTDAQTYDVYGITLAEVEVDILTGETEILRVDLYEDAGKSISPEVDIGQVEGAFIMGQGFWTNEHLVYDKKTGELLTDRLWNYFVPQARDIPQDIRIDFREKSYTADAIYGSKCVGEPPICMAVAIPLAIREAISEARYDSGINTSEWFDIDGPYTVEHIGMSMGTKFADFKFK